MMLWTYPRRVRRAVIRPSARDRAVTPGQVREQHIEQIVVRRQLQQRDKVGRVGLGAVSPAVHAAHVDLEPPGQFAAGLSWRSGKSSGNCGDSSR